MLYKFKSRATAPVLVLRHSGDLLLSSIGRTPDTYGATVVEDMQEALGRLHRAVELSECQEDPPPDNEVINRQVESLRQRARPLIDMLERSLAERRDVVWALCGGQASKPA